MCTYHGKAVRDVPSKAKDKNNRLIPAYRDHIEEAGVVVGEGGGERDKNRTASRETRVCV